MSGIYLLLSAIKVASYSRRTAAYVRDGKLVRAVLEMLYKKGLIVGYEVGSFGRKFGCIKVWIRYDEYGSPLIRDYKLFGQARWRRMNKRETLLKKVTDVQFALFTTRSGLIWWDDIVAKARGEGVPFVERDAARILFSLSV